MVVAMGAAASGTAAAAVVIATVEWTPQTQGTNTLVMMTRSPMLTKLTTTTNTPTLVMVIVTMMA